MAKKDPFDLARDMRGNYTVCKGVRLTTEGNYTKAVFYLGRDKAQAAINSIQVEKAWNAVHDRWYRLRDGERAAWDETTFAIAKAVGLGKKEVVVSYPVLEVQEDMGKVAIALHAWHTDLQERFPWVKIVPEQGRMAELVDRWFDLKKEVIEIDRQELETARPSRSSTGPNLSAALEGYCDHVKTKYRDTEGHITDFGMLVTRRVSNMRDHLGDKLQTPLSQVGTTFLDNWEIYWANRPRTKKGSPCSKEWAEGVISSIRDFIRWLNRTDLFRWDKPKTYEVMPRPVKETPDELGAIPEKKRYKRSELPTLWEYATPRERVYLLLALNCGFGEGEITTLRKLEVVFGQKNYIQRKRRKTGIFCKWRLWPETVEALQWYLKKVRPETDSPYLFISDKGRPFASRTKGGNRGQHISNAWDKLHARIAKDKPDFVKLSFNKLRKTGSNWIRQKYNVELADLYLSHGKKTEADAYTEKRYVPMYRAIRHYRKVIDAMFRTVAIPFPEVTKKSNPSLSLGRIKRLQRLRQQGFTLKRIALDEKVSSQTVQRYTKKPDSNKGLVNEQG